MKQSKAPEKPLNSHVIMFFKEWKQIDLQSATILINAHLLKCEFIVMIMIIKSISVFFSGFLLLSKTNGTFGRQTIKKLQTNMYIWTCCCVRMCTRTGLTFTGNAWLSPHTQLVWIRFLNINCSCFLWTKCEILVINKFYCTFKIWKYIVSWAPGITLTHHSEWGTF